MKRPIVDPEIQLVVDDLKRADPRLFPSLTIDQLPRAREVANERAQSDLATAMQTYGDDFRMSEREVHGPDAGQRLSLLIFEPNWTGRERPVIYWIHGGGMVMGDRRSSIDQPLLWANEHGAVVISVEYRLAPEHPHPAPAEDCYAGLAWLVENADGLGVDPRQLLVAGRSAGGGLAAAVALMARDRGGPCILGELLLAPMLDDQERTVSSLMLDGECNWDRTSNRTGWRALLGSEAAGPDVSPYAAPARAEDLSGLPPTYLDVGSVDTFRDEVIAYASKFWECGGQAELHVWPGACHGSDRIAPQATLSTESQIARSNWIRRRLPAQGG